MKGYHSDDPFNLESLLDLISGKSPSGSWMRWLESRRGESDMQNSTVGIQFLAHASAHAFGR